LLTILEDHPDHRSSNGGPFNKYPQLITWIMSRKHEMHFANAQWAQDRSSLGGTDREMTLYEIAVLTRANPARTVG